MRAILFALLLMPLSAFAQQEPDVPEKAIDEILRRGALVEETGTINDDDTAAVVRALQPPEDDSHKWFITLISQANCAPCERLKKDFASEAKLRAWADVSDPKKSFTHFHIRDEADPTQKDWIKPLRERLTAFPALIIQPPTNGEYGKPSTVVSIIYGYDGDAEKYGLKIREKILTYVEYYERKRSLDLAINPQVGGIGQTGDNRPPFILPDRHNPNNPGPAPVPPDDYPNLKKALTIEEMKMLAPDAPMDFILSQAQAGQKDKMAFLAAWEMAKPKVLTLDEMKKLAPDAPDSFLLTQLGLKQSDAQAFTIAWLTEKNGSDPKMPSATREWSMASIILSVIGLLVLSGVLIVMILLLTRKNPSNQAEMRAILAAIQSSKAGSSGL